MELKPIVTGIASYGMSGQVFHAPLLEAHPGFTLRYVVERSQKRAQERYPALRSLASFEELLQQPDVELIIVNTPNETHFPYTQLALQAGKHVVVEKPFTNTVAEGQALIALAEEKKLKLSVFQNRRWDSDFQTVVDIVRSGVLGEVVELEAHFDRWRNYIEPATWKEEEGPGSGIVYNLGSHRLDQALVLFGMPKALWADLRIQRPGGKVLDHFHIILDYGPTKVTLKAGYLVKEALPQWQVLGTQGSFVKYGIDPQEAALKAGIPIGSEGWGHEPEQFWGTLNTQLGDKEARGPVESRQGDYLAYYSSVYKSIRRGQPLAVTAQQALDVIHLIEATYQSHVEKRWVSLV